MGVEHPCCDAPIIGFFLLFGVGKPARPCWRMSRFKEPSICSGRLSPSCCTTMPHRRQDGGRGARSKFPWRNGSSVMISCRATESLITSSCKCRGSDREDSWRRKKKTRRQSPLGAFDNSSPSTVWRQPPPPSSRPVQGRPFQHWVPSLPPSSDFPFSGFRCAVANRGAASATGPTPCITDDWSFSGLGHSSHTQSQPMAAAKYAYLTRTASENLNSHAHLVSSVRLLVALAWFVCP